MAFVRTLRFRISLLFMLILALVIGLLSALVYVGLQQTLLRAVDDSLQKAAERSVSTASTNDPNITPDEKLPGLTPIGALRDNRGTEIKRRAQAGG